MKVNVRFEAARLDHSNPQARRYPFPEMQVGDGMAVRYPVPFAPASAAASTWAKKHGWTFKRMTIDGVNVIVRTA